MIRNISEYARQEGGYRYNWFSKLTAILICFSLMGCGSFISNILPVVQKALVVIQDANLILDSIDRAVVPYLAAGDNKKLAMDYDLAMSKARRSLTVALRTVQGVESLSEEDRVAAFAEFREAYVELEALLMGAGLVKQDGALSAAPGRPQLYMAKPLAAE